MRGACVLLKERYWSSCLNVKADLDLHFCVACVAWQTHRDHVCPHRRRPASSSLVASSSSASSVSSSHFSFPFNNFWRNVLISFKFCRTLYHYKIQVKSDIGNHSSNVDWVMALFRLSFCWCVDIGFRSITFAGMHWFYWKLAEGYIIVKYRWSLILVIIRKILA